MEILSNRNNREISNCVLTMGNFDGIHAGHVEIINLVNKISAKQSSKSLLVTFNPHPAQVFNKKDNLDNCLITPLAKKIDLLNSLNLDFLYIIDFNKKFANITADDFIINFLYKKFKPTDIIIGYDHFFGKDRAGSFKLLQKYAGTLNYNIHKVDEIKLRNLNIKSNIIRNLIKKGSIVKANSLLGRKFSFQGKVVHGRGLGRKLSFPTANIHIDDQAQLLPKDGVYSTEIFIKKNKKRYNSVCNIGVRPTFNDDSYDRTIEVHILSDKNFDIYNHEIELIFKGRIRDEIKFHNKEDLINQIDLDKEYCINNSIIEE